MKRFFLICLISFLCLTTVFGICSQKDVCVSYAGGEVDLSCKSACLVDYASGEILFAKNANEKRPVASMVKMMTILLTLEDLKDGRIDLKDTLTTSENASSMGGSQVFVEPYQKYSIEDMLKSVIISSANDASVALAEHLNGSEETFVKRMNKRAKQLGMENTHYVNCTGLPTVEQFSSAFDSAKLLKEIVKFDTYHNYSTTWIDTLKHSKGRETELVNTNKLIRYYEGCDGGKTGSTNEAGCCLSATAKRGDMRLISVVVGAENSKTRFNECSKLFNYGFANFKNEKLVCVDTAIESVSVLKGKLSQIELFAKEDFVALVKKGDTSAYTYDIIVKEKIKAPILENEELGKIVIMKNGQEIKQIPLVSKVKVDKLNFGDMFKNVVEKW